MTERAREQEHDVGRMSVGISPPSPTLRGRCLLLARAAWMAVAVATLGAFVAAVPARYAQLANPTEAVRTALAQIGPPAGAYAFYNVALDTLFVSVFTTIGILIFWRRSNDAMVLLVATMLVTSNGFFTQLGSWGKLYRSLP